MCPPDQLRSTPCRESRRCAPLQGSARLAAAGDLNGGIHDGSDQGACGRRLGIRDASGQSVTSAIRSAGEEAAAIDRAARVRSRGSAHELQGGGERARLDPDGDQPSGPAARGDLPAAVVPPAAAADRVDDDRGEIVSLIRNGLDAFAAALSEVTEGPNRQPLRVTTTNAFASRWLVPRLPLWRAAQPQIELEIIGTDELIDLRGW
jgi:hypothetical protein